MALFFHTISANAAINQQINYQGKLTNASNVTVGDDVYNMEFKLYTASSSGVAIWTETRTGANKVQVTNGLFSVMLGSVTSLTGINFNQTLYLGVNIGGTSSPSWDGEMTPRKILGAVPAAIESYNLGGASSTQYIRADQPGTLAASSSQIALAITQTGSGDLFSVGSSFFSILNNGNVGVGTNSSGAKLNVNNSVDGASAEVLRLQNSGISSPGAYLTFYGGINENARIEGRSNSLRFSTGTSATEWLRIDSSGKVGIGTTTSNFLLTVAGTSNFTNALNFNGNAGSSGYVLQSTGSGSVPTWVATSTLGITATLSGGTQDFVTRWLTPTTVGTGKFIDNGTVTGINATSTSYTFNVQGTGGTNPFNIASSTGTSFLNVNQKGNFGINTSIQTTKLAIQDNGAAVTTLMLANNSGNSGDYNQIKFQYAPNDSSWGAAIRSIVIDNTVSDGGLSLLTDNSGGTLTERMRIGTGGNVGIATTTSNFLLSVAGAANFTSALNFNGSSGSSGSVLQSNGASAPTWVATSTLGITATLSGGTKDFVTRWLTPTTVGTGKFIDNGTVTGINATSTSYTFNVQGTGGTNPFNIASSTGTSILSVLQNGNVGIGTTTPLAVLSVKGAGTGTGINFTTTNSSNTSLFSILDNGNVGISTTTPNALLSIAGISGSSTQLFDVASSSGATYLHVTSAGNVGIGTSTPTSALQVISTTEQFRLNYNSTNFTKFTVGSASTLTLTPGVDATGAFNFTKADGATSILDIDSTNGRVGIGTTTPSAKLDIWGNLNVATGTVPALFVDTTKSFVGIGSSTPTTNLSVNGNALINGSLTLTTPLGVASGGNGNSTYTNGQLMIGNTVGNTLTKATLTGTASQLTVTNGNGTITLSTPQNTDTAATPQFGRLGLGAAADASIILSATRNVAGTTTVARFLNSNAATVNNGALLYFNAQRSIAGATDIANIGALITDISSTVYKGALMFSTASGTAPTEKLRIDSVGNVGIGTTTASQILVASGTIQATNLYGGATTLSTDVNGNIIRTPSDAKLKEQVVNIDDATALNQVLNLQGVSYYWKDKSRFGSSQEIGFIAQEVEKVVPQVVKDGGEYKSLNYGNLTAVVVGAIKQQQKTIQQNASSTATALAALNLRVSTLESLNHIITPPSFGGTLWDTLQSFGAEVVDGISYLQNVFVEHFTTQNLTIKGKDITKTGFTIYDRKTGLPICVYFEYGVQKTENGECPDSNATSTPDVLPQTPPILDPTLDASTTKPSPLPPVDASTTPPIVDASSTLPAQIVTPPDEIVPPVTPPAGDQTGQAGQTSQTQTGNTDSTVSAPQTPPVTPAGSGE